MPETGSRNDPYAAFNFLVEIEGVTVAGFAECSGLSADQAVIEYREGAEDITVRKLPGLKTFTNILLKRGYTQSKELWNWRKQVMDGKTRRQAGSVVLLNEARQEALRWNFREGWPKKWDGPTFNAKGNDVAIEALEIAHEGIALA
jgi:phage tail-like protein